MWRENLYCPRYSCKAGSEQMFRKELSAQHKYAATMNIRYYLLDLNERMFFEFNAFLKWGSNNGITDT